MKMNWYGNSISEAIEKAGQKALTDAAEYILDEANKTVPHDEGTLELSGKTDVGNKEASISYDTPYAVRLHEHPEYNFQGKGRGKWLELTLKEKEKRVRDYMAKEMKRVLKG